MTAKASRQALSSVVPEDDEIRAALDAILSAPAFLRSERQSQFLRFVCDTAIKGDAAKLNEYVIAHEVFGRGADYSPGEDSIVRRQAHSLRQKLHDYYAQEGRDSQIRINIPSGHYVPVFTHVDQPGGPPALPESTAPVPDPLSDVRQITAPRPLALATLIALFFLALGYWMGTMFHGNRLFPSLDPAISEIWGPWLSDPLGAVICLSNPLTAVVKQFPFALPLEPHRNPPRIVVTPEQSEQFRRFFELPPGGHFYLYPAFSQSKMGEALGTATLTAMLTRAGLTIHATQSRFLSWDSFRNQNLILIGHDEANRWLDPILDRLPMRMVTTEADKARHIIVSAPAGAKPDEFYLEFPADVHSISRDYALVSMLAGVDEKHQLLLINGLNTEGTQIAMEYLSDPKRLRELLTRLHASAPAHKGLWRFQFILRTEVRDQVPITADLLIVKVL